MSIAQHIPPQAALEARAVLVAHGSSSGGECRYCHHPIRLYREVGWVDTTPPVYGGCYDMCSGALSGQHEPRTRT